MPQTVRKIGPYDNPDSVYGEYQPGDKSGFYTSKIPRPKTAYPSSLLSESMKNVPFIHLNVVSPSSNKRSRYAIGLPFPTSVKVNYNANWDTINLGAMTGSITDALKQGESLTGSGSVNWGKIGDVLSRGARGAGASVAQNALSMIDEHTGMSAAAATEIANRIQVNPHAALRFMGMSFREFILDFTLLPKNEEDSKQIREVIFQLKYAMHPEGNNISSGGGQRAGLSSYFGYPEEFIIGFYAPNLKNLFRTSPCELLSCTVEYNGAGVPAFFRNDKPVCIVLSLHFKESEILTKERIRQGW